MIAAVKKPVRQNPSMLPDWIKDGTAQLKKNISLKAVVADIDLLQMRACGISPEHVLALADLLVSGRELEPIVIFQDADGTLRIADGFHRYTALCKAGRKTIDAWVIMGGLDEATLFAANANQSLCLPLTREDRKRAAIKLHLKFPKMPGYKIALTVGLGSTTVNDYIYEYQVSQGVKPGSHAQTGRGRYKRHGRSYMAVVDGKARHIATSAEKAKEAFEESSKCILQNCFNLGKWLTRDSVCSSRRFARIGSAQLSVLMAGSAAICPFSGGNELPSRVMSLVWARAELGATRAILLVDNRAPEPDWCERIRAIGFEVIKLQDLVETLKAASGEATNGNQTPL